MCAAVSTGNHQEWLEAYIMCDRSGNTDFMMCAEHTDGCTKKGQCKVFI
jgi:hypothetical protein